MTTPPIDQPTLSHSALQALPMPVAILDQQGVIVSVNAAWRQAMADAGAWDIDDPIGTPYVQICEQASGPQKDMHAAFQKALQHVLEGRRNHYVRSYTVRLNHEDRPHQVVINALSGPGAVIMHQDLGPSSASGRHRALQAKEREETLPRLAEHAPVLMWTCDENGQSQWFNKRWLDFCHMTLEEALSSDWHTRIHSEDYKRVIKTASDARKNKIDYYHRFRMQRADGEYRWLQERGQPLAHHDGRYAGYIGSCTDVSDIIRTEEDLAQHRDHLHRQLQFSGALNRMSQAVIGMDEQDAILSQLLEIVGRVLGVESTTIMNVLLSERQAHIISQWDQKHGAQINTETTYDLDQFSDSLRHAWEMRTPLESHATQINPRFSNEGSAHILHDELGIRSLLWLPFSFQPDGFLVLGIHQLSRHRVWIADEREFIASAGNVVDLALQKNRMLQERKDNAMQLLQAGKMEAMGRLAGGIAHDFNNLLTAITGHSNLLQRGLPNGHPLRNHADTIIRAADRAAETTRHLLSFSRQQPIKSKVLDPNKIIERLRTLMDRLIPENITIQIDLIANIGHVVGDPGQLELALMNLSINARDAMRDGGRLTILSREENIDAALGRRYGVMAGLYIAVSVRDTGIGMNKTTVDRLFEPFFTTKDIGQGTGLGLSSAYGAIRSMHGFIGVVSVPKEGTTMTIYLPKVLSDERSTPTPLHLAVLGGHETVLLVEDNAAVLELTRDALRSQGYNVLAAHDGDEAMRLASEHPQAIDLLLTDLVLPGLGGESLAIRLRAAQPTLKIIISSGYAADAFSTSPELKQVGFLAKPYTVDELMRTVRQAIDAPAV